MLQSIVHYSLHFIICPLIGYVFWFKDKRKAILATLIILATMLIDLDHLLATPIFDPNRYSIGFHPLHSYLMIGLYILLLVFPYKAFKLPWYFRTIALGLTLHIITDWLDFNVLAML